MQKERGISRLSSDDLKQLREAHASLTDLGRVRSMPEAELERAIADDADFRDVPDDWVASAEAVMPTPKKLISLRLDANVIDWFRQQGPGYQTRINAVLEVYVAEAKKRLASAGR